MKKSISNHLQCLFLGQKDSELVTLPSPVFSCHASSSSLGLCRTLRTSKSKPMQTGIGALFNLRHEQTQQPSCPIFLATELKGKIPRRLCRSSHRSLPTLSVQTIQVKHLSLGTKAMPSQKGNFPLLPHLYTNIMAEYENPLSSILSTCVNCQQRQKTSLKAQLT